MTVGKVAVREPVCTNDRVIEVGVPLLFLTTFTFPSIEKSRVLIYCWVNQWHKGTSMSLGEQGEIFEKSRAEAVY